MPVAKRHAHIVFMVLQSRPFSFFGRTDAGKGKVQTGNIITFRSQVAAVPSASATQVQHGTAICRGQGGKERVYKPVGFSFVAVTVKAVVICGVKPGAEPGSFLQGIVQGDHDVAFTC